MQYNPLSVQSNSRQNAIRSNLSGVDLPEDSKSWLIQNLDPFHDGQFSMRAPPTPSQLDSIVQLRRSRVSISVPAQQSDGHTGDLSIFVPPVPVGVTLECQSWSTAGNAYSTKYGGIMVRDYDATATPDAYQTVATLDAPRDASWRVVGFGYELTNTTPTMFQSGSLVTYQAAQSLHRSAYNGSSQRHPTATPTADYHTDFVSSDLLGLPYPATIDEATAYPTAKQWDAKHGAYVIPRLTSFDSDFMSPLVPDDESLRRVLTGSTIGPSAWT